MHTFCSYNEPSRTWKNETEQQTTAEVYCTTLCHLFYLSKFKQNLKSPFRFYSIHTFRFWGDIGIGNISPDPHRQMIFQKFPTTFAEISFSVSEPEYVT